MHTFSVNPPTIRLSVAFLLLSLIAPAQQQTAPTRTDEPPIFRVPSDLVFLPTRVQARNGQTVYGLTQDQFIVHDNGVRQTVRVEEGPESKGLSLVIAIQCGRAAPAEFDNLKGLGALVEGIVGAAQHEIAVVVYGERPYLLSAFSTSVETTRQALSRLKPCGDYHAAAIDAVHYSLNLLKAREVHYRRAILLIGEQRDHGSSGKLHEVFGELGTTNTVIYVVAFSPAKNEFLRGLRYGPDGPRKPDPPFIYPPRARTPAAPPAVEPVDDPPYEDHPPTLALPPLLLLAVNALRDNTASELASLSGGEYMRFVTRRGFDQALNRIANQVHNYYVLSFQPVSSAAPGIHSLDVRVAGHPEAVIQTRKSYWSGIAGPNPDSPR